MGYVAVSVETTCLSCSFDLFGLIGLNELDWLEDGIRR